MTQLRPSRPSSSGWFAAWIVVGAGAALAVLAAMTIGVFILPVVAVAAVLLGRVRAARNGLAGLLCGAAVPVFYVAWLNRDGPGEVCRTDGAGSSCIEQWSPWPWIAVGVALTAISFALYLRRR